MEDFADITKNPEEWRKATTVLNAILDDMDENIANQGGVWAAVKNAGGITAAMQQAKTAVIGDQLRSLPNQHDRDYVNTALTALSMLVGMRAANKGSAAKFSVKALANDIPKEDTGVETQQDFYKKLSKLGVAVSTSMHGIGGFSDEDKNYIDAQTNRLMRLGKQSTAPGGEKPFTPPPRTPGVDGYYDPVQKKVVYH
jgi:hypothetical protein